MNFAWEFTDIRASRAANIQQNYLLKLSHTKNGPKTLENKGYFATSVNLFFELYLCFYHLE